MLDTLQTQVGQFRSITGTRPEEMAGYRIVFVTCQFDKAALDLRLVYDGKGRVAGMFFAPSEPKVEWSAPAYANPGAFEERETVVVSGSYRLPATLSLPKGKGPFPAIVLVHGSGPQDRDETIGANKPFKDLAWGLASRGVAVLRYTKRTLLMAESKSPLPAVFTVKEETVEDALAAVSHLAGMNTVDARRVYVLGHSLGGMVAPRIAAGDKSIAGIVLMAGTTRPLEQVIVDQLKYLASLPGNNTAEANKRIQAAEQAAKEIQDSALTPTARIDLLGSRIPGSYFLDLRDYHPAEAAAQLKVRMLVLQGERDYQVTMKDFEGWKTALGGRPDVTFKVYPGLTHLFMPSSSPGTGPGTPDDYSKPGHVVEAVIADIESWILAGATSRK
jgi:dienelactone hydrolase